MLDRLLIISIGHYSSFLSNIGRYFAKGPINMGKAKGIHSVGQIIDFQYWPLFLILSNGGAKQVIYTADT